VLLKLGRRWSLGGGRCWPAASLWRGCQLAQRLGLADELVAARAVPAAEQPLLLPLLHPPAGQGAPLMARPGLLSPSPARRHDPIDVFFPAPSVL